LTADKAERTWQAKCASCHGDDGRGQTKKGLEMQVKDFTTPVFQSGTTKDKLKMAIEMGVNRSVPAAPAKDAVNGKKVTASVVKPQAQVKQQMDGYRDKLKPEQIDDLVVYIWSLKK
jgi:cytochrome c